jgi:hypothetical protein
MANNKNLNLSTGIEQKTQPYIASAASNERYRPKLPWAAGACAGIVEILITFPLEFLKTQAQLSAITTSPTINISSTSNTIKYHVKTTFETKGVLGFYKGLSP